MKSVLKPTSPTLRQYDIVRVQKHYEQQAQYFTIVTLGRVADPVNCSFVHRDGFKALLYCEANPSLLQYSIPIDYSGIIFELTARIDRSDCFLTAEGDHGHPYGADEDKNDPFASGWFKAPGDTREDAFAWKQALEQLKRITECAAGEDVAMGELVTPNYEQGRDSPLALLQLSWRPPRSYTLDYLPVFTMDHRHWPIPSLASVPFNRRVRVRFTLHGVPAQAGLPAIVGAHMLYMHILD